MPRPKYTKTPFFETLLVFRRFWVKEPRHSENSLAGMCYLYRRTASKTFTSRTDQIDQIDHLDRLLLEFLICPYERLRIVYIVQTQPRKLVL